MRKRIVEMDSARTGSEFDRGWLDLKEIAVVEVTSEDPSHPIESVFGQATGSGWRASHPGEQRIRVLFDKPVSLRRVRLRFDEPNVERTQEFVLRWSSDTGQASTEIVRQQWNFSPGGSTTEIEEYDVVLNDVSVLELAIKPDIGGRGAVASLSSLQLG